MYYLCANYSFSRAYEEKKNSIMSSSENEDIVLELEDLENGIAAQLALDFS